MHGLVYLSDRQSFDAGWGYPIHEAIASTFASDELDENVLVDDAANHHATATT